MKRTWLTIAIVALAWLLFIPPPQVQQALAQAGYVMYGSVLSACGGAAYVAGTNRAMVLTPTGYMCIQGTVTTNVIGSSAVDRSLSVTTGGTSQQLMASNSSRKGYLIQNFGCGATANGNVYVGQGVAASRTDGKSVNLPPCASLFVLGTAIDQEVINVTSDNTGAKISSKEFQ